MKLLDELEKNNKMISEVSSQIDDLLMEQTQAHLGWRILRWILQREVKKVIFDKDEDGEEEEISRDEIKKRIKKWERSSKKEENIDNVVKDVADLTGTDNEKDNEKLREMLVDIIKQQRAIVDDMQQTKGIQHITVNFNEPIKFELRRGKASGKELKLEKTKTYDVFKVEKIKNKYKVYFVYKTRKENWMKDYSIMFALTLNSLKTGVKNDRVTVHIVYMNEQFIQDKEFKILEEKVLTHRAMVEIKRAG